jgi:hypothetical protein
MRSTPLCSGQTVQLRDHHAERVGNGDGLKGRTRSSPAKFVLVPQPHRTPPRSPTRPRPAHRASAQEKAQVGTSYPVRRRRHGGGGSPTIPHDYAAGGGGSGRTGRGNPVTSVHSGRWLCGRPIRRLGAPRPMGSGRPPAAPSCSTSACRRLWWTCGAGRRRLFGRTAPLPCGRRHRTRCRARGGAEWRWRRRSRKVLSGCPWGRGTAARRPRR